MKKTIAILLVVVLVVGGLGGFAYAQVNGHVPMTGQKLVGCGAYGSKPVGDETYHLHTMFTIVNPDCVSEITIHRVSIIDQYGTVWYEDEPLWPSNEPMKPHELRSIELHDYPEYLPEALEGYTVEIFWTWTDKKGLPLTGWQLSSVGLLDAEENLIEMTSSESQMVNMKQVLEPEKPK